MCYELWCTYVQMDLVKISSSVDVAIKTHTVFTCGRLLSLLYIWIPWCIGLVRIYEWICHSRPLFLSLSSFSQIICRFYHTQDAAFDAAYNNPPGVCVCVLHPPWKINTHAVVSSLVYHGIFHTHSIIERYRYEQRRHFSAFIFHKEFSPERKVRAQNITMHSSFRQSSFLLI